MSQSGHIFQLVQWGLYKQNPMHIIRDEGLRLAATVFAIN